MASWGGGCTGQITCTGTKYNTQDVHYNLTVLTHSYHTSYPPCDPVGCMAVLPLYRLNGQTLSMCATASRLSRI